MLNEKLQVRGKEVGVAIVQDPKKRAPAEEMTPTMIEFLEPLAELGWQESVPMMSVVALLERK